MNQFDMRMSRYTQQVEDGLIRWLPSEDCPQKSCQDAMAYSLLGGGKRIRGILALAFAECCGGDAKRAVPFAAAVEMVHAYSLIHDDLPCMDDDNLRRGKPSCHIQFGEAVALLAGDALLTQAFATVLDEETINILGASTCALAAQRLAHAAGIHGMVGGQVLDMEHEGQAITQQQLDHGYSLKTGALIRVSAQLGCLAAGADETMCNTAANYAHCIGLTFQIVDDILDVISDDATLGKPVGSDVQQHKTTYVSLYGLEASRRVVDELVEQAGQVLRQGNFPGETGFLSAFAEKMAIRAR